MTVEAETGDPDSMLELYRTALRIRHAEPALGDGPMTWLPTGNGVLAFDRETDGGADGSGGGADGSGGAGGADGSGGGAGGGRTGVRCVTNLSPAPVDLPAHAAVLLTSGPLEGGLLPPDTAAWLRVP